jgi:hypothetical protein
MKPTTVLCAECDRPVSDSVPLCQTCTDEFVADLMSVPGLVADIAITAARLDRMGRARNGGKSADTPLPIRIDKADHLPHRRPFDMLVNVLVTWGRVIEEHYGIKIPLGAAGLRELVRANRVGADEQRPQADVELVRLPVYEIEQEEGKRVLAGYRVVARTPRRDPEALDMTPITPAEIVAVWLAHNPASIRLMPASHEMITEVSNAIARARMAVDRMPELRFLGPCPNVTGETKGGEPIICAAGLRAEKGETWVRCPRCRTQFEVEKIIADAKRRIEDNRWTLARIGEYMAALGMDVPKRDLYDLDHHPRLSVPKRGWMRKNHEGKESISPEWIHRGDPPVFRVGDVVRYFERRLAKTGTDHRDAARAAGRAR